MKVKKYLNPSSPLIKRKRRLFYFTPEQEKLFNLVTVPGTNINSNATDARKTGVQALNFLAQEAARKDAEIESRSDRKTVKRLTTVGERLRGDNGYSSYMSAGTPMSGWDPALGTIFDWTVGAKGIDALGKTALWNYAKYGSSNLFRGLARNYFINNAFKLELKKPILFGVGETLQPQTRTRVGDVEINNPGLNYRVGTKEIIKDFQNSGVVRAGEVNSQKPNRAGRFLLTKQTFLAPMFKLGSLWYQPSEEMNGLLVTSEPLVVANKYANPVANKGIFTIEGKTFANDFGGRRIPAEGLILNKSNTTAYAWSPGYGYKLVVEEPSTAYFGDPTLNFLKFVGNPKLGRETAANSIFYGPEKNLVEELKNSGVNLSKIPKESITLALNKRRELINLTAPNSYTLVEGNPILHFNYLLYDYRNGKPVGWMNVDRNKKDLNTYVQGVENTDPSYKGTYEKLLNSSIITSQSLGGLGNISGLQLISAPKQYHVLQKFRDRKLTPYKGTHTNARMVYDKLGLETEDTPANSILDLSKAGDKLTKTLSNAPVWLLKSPTFLVPTKSTVFNPYIIDFNGKMHINWDDILIQHKYGGKIK